MLTERKAIKEEIIRLCRLHATLSTLLEHSGDEAEAQAVQKRLETIALRIGVLYVQRRRMKQPTPPILPLPTKAVIEHAA